VVLFCLAITSYDLGFDEAAYITYAKTFSRYLFPFTTMNGSTFGGEIYMVDNISMLPFYLLSFIQFLVNLTEIWHFKLLAVLLSSISIVSLFYIFNKWYDLKFSIVFLFLLIIQPGFGYMASSYFGEITQSAFFFLAIYIWFREDKDLRTNHIVCVSLLFTLAAHTKVQILPVLLLSLLVFNFVDKTKYSLRIFVLVIAFYISIFIIRSLPIIFYDQSIFLKMIQFWFYSGMSIGIHFTAKIYPIGLVNRFFSLLLIVFILSFSTFIIKKPLEKFIFIFTILHVLFYIFAFQLWGYRHFFMAVIPLVFLASLVLVTFYKDYYSKLTKTNKVIILLLILLLMIWGFSTNITYAVIGYNNGVEFDLGGQRNQLMNWLHGKVEHDGSQQRFYNDLKKHLTSKDSVYVANIVISFYTTQYYLPDNPVYDFEHFKTALDSSRTKKYVILDIASFPPGLEPGGKLLDSLKVNMQLLVKEGDFELYSVTRH
jgi:hypothetical protein